MAWEVNAMKDRIKAIRKRAGLNQQDFGKKCGVSLSAVQKWESGENTVSDAVILLICQRFGINEEWLRTGQGEMTAPLSREAELANYVREILVDSPDSFKAALVTTLLRFDPNGPEWAVIESIFEKTMNEMKRAGE